MNNSPALSNQQFEEETIDLREYWSVIRRHQWGIVGLAFAITLLAIVVVFSLDSVYQARATILLESQQAKVVSIEQVYGLNNKNMDYYYSQLEILKSRSIAEKVVKKLQLTTNAEFDPRQQKEPLIKFSLTGFIKDIMWLYLTGHTT